MNWWLDHVIFAPLDYAKGRSGVVKVLAIIVFIPWFVVTAWLGVPLIMLWTLRELWGTLK